MNDSSFKSLFYHKLGHGPNILLAFHGIGQDGLSCFRTFEEQLGHHYTIYAFDLFFHGESNTNDINLVTKQLWNQVLTDFLSEQNITSFDIAGFSIGGRFALATLEAFPAQINNAFLIAPDGISEHPLYSFASRFGPARQVFHWLIENPGTFFNTVHILQKTGMINSSLARFAEKVMDTPEKRLTIYKSWTGFRELQFNIPALSNSIKSHQIRTFLITGKFDKLLKTQAVKPLSHLLPEKQNVILKSGHSQLVAQAGAWICTLFE